MKKALAGIRACGRQSRTRCASCFAAPQPHPSWEETDNDPEDLSLDLAQRAREAEGPGRRTRRT